MVLRRPEERTTHFVLSARRTGACASPFGARALPAVAGVPAGPAVPAAADAPDDEHEPEADEHHRPEDAGRDLTDHAEGAENQVVTDSQLVTRPPPIDGPEGEELELKVKATVCHTPPGNPANARTLSIGAPAVFAHTGHGDSVGPCP